MVARNIFHKQVLALCIVAIICVAHSANCVSISSSLYQSSIGFLKRGAFAVYECGWVIFWNGTCFASNNVRYGWVILDVNESHATLKVTLNASGYDRKPDLSLSRVISIDIHRRLCMDYNSGELLGIWSLWINPWEVEVGKNVVVANDWLGLKIETTIHTPSIPEYVDTPLGRFPIHECFQLYSRIKQKFSIGVKPKPEQNKLDEKSGGTVSSVYLFGDEINIIRYYHLRTGLLLASHGLPIDDALHTGFNVAAFYPPRKGVVYEMLIAETNIHLEGIEQHLSQLYYWFAFTIISCSVMLAAYVWMRWFKRGIKRERDY